MPSPYYPNLTVTLQIKKRRDHQKNVHSLYYARLHFNKQNICASYRKLNIFAVPFRSINPFKMYIGISVIFCGFYELVIWSGILCWYSWTSALVSLPAKIKEVEENISCLNDISTWWLSLISLLEFRFSFSGIRFSLCELLKRYFRNYFKDLFWISISGWNRFQN